MEEAWQKVVYKGATILNPRALSELEFLRCKLNSHKNRIICHPLSGLRPAATLAAMFQSNAEAHLPELNIKRLFKAKMEADFWLPRSSALVHATV